LDTVTAFVLINTESGTEKEVLSELKMIREIKEAYTIHGVYDILTRIEDDDAETIKDVLEIKIRKLEKVRSTLTMICIDS